MEMVGHQLAVQQGDVTLAGLARPRRLLFGYLPLYRWYLLPAAQHLAAQGRRLYGGLARTVSRQPAQERLAPFGTEGDEIDASAVVVVVLTALVHLGHVAAVAGLGRVHRFNLALFCYLELTKVQITSQKRSSLTPFNSNNSFNSPKSTIFAPRI
jgi:hypothetical protein